MNMKEQEKEKVLNKVRRILLIAQKTNYEGEAETAMLKAQALMVEHGLTVEDVSADEEGDGQEVISVEADAMGQRLTHWRGTLAVIIAENFRCKVFVLYRELRKSKQATLRFRGRQGIRRHEDEEGSQQPDQLQRRSPGRRRRI